MAVAKIVGLDNVLKNLNKEIMKIENRTLGGLIKAAAYIRKDMDRQVPVIPVDTGNLRASWYVKPYRMKSNLPVVQIGFSASYAWFVHEMIGANFAGEMSKVKWSVKTGRPTEKSKKFYRRAGAGPKFLEAALKRNVAIILGIIRDNVKISK